MQVFDEFESGVRSYCRAFPDVFIHASGAWITGRSGRRYIDFFSGAGALNYGHNPPGLKRALIAYLEADGLLQGLDMATVAKERFLLAFNEIVLAPRGLAYRMLFPGPTGANCVEVGLKLARRATGRRRIIAFTGGFHGMSLGALAATWNEFHRSGAGVPLRDVEFMPFDGSLGPTTDSLDVLAHLLDETAGENEKPAACIVETVQGEGGCNVASIDWLRRLQGLCRAHGMLLIVDDIQAGCGRTGSFFSFEPAGIEPDIICLSKSLSGYGLPMSLALVKPQYDVLKPGQHSGTFRGNNAAFVTATEALEQYWRDDALMDEVEIKSRQVTSALATIVAAYPQHLIGVRGRGLMQGLVFRHGELSCRTRERCFGQGLIIETCGSSDDVIKVLCPLTIPGPDLRTGLKILSDAVDWALGNLPSSDDSNRSVFDWQ
jgi:diaminobutyrate-2-oxoglutarate transaminase